MTDSHLRFLVGWIQRSARAASSAFPEAVGVAVCMDVSEPEPIVQETACTPLWIPGEVLFVDAKGRCVVTGRTLQGSGRFQNFSLKQLTAAIACSKLVAKRTAHLYDPSARQALKTADNLGHGPTVKEVVLQPH